ncbi:hypothetical protein CRUP_027658 [Coryphaenoides rupestris]|nr:hypothetical protein CRUP_027658 [Coryphaenoides rupestris]
MGRLGRRHALNLLTCFELRVTQLVDSQSDKGAVQPEQFLGVLVEPSANQEAREAWCQEEQGADVSLVGHKDSKGHMEDGPLTCAPSSSHFTPSGGPENSSRTALTRLCRGALWEPGACDVLEAPEHGPRALDSLGVVDAAELHLLLRRQKYGTRSWRGKYWSLEDTCRPEDKCLQRDNLHNNNNNNNHHNSSKPDHTELNDAEVVRRAREEGRVDVVLAGTVSQEGCCRVVSEILKCILYQRQQLPMTYDQLVYSQKKEHGSIQDEEVVSWRSAQTTDSDRRKCLRTLGELEEVFQHLEQLFSLSLVPRVLLLLGGSLILPKELYEIDMEALVLAACNIL